MAVSLIEENMRLQAKLRFSVPTAILASETLKSVALQDIEGCAHVEVASGPVSGDDVSRCGGHNKAR
jgi:hypothetical protein